MIFKDLVKKHRMVGHLAFIGGIQLSACVEILVDYYMATEHFLAAIAPVVGALLIGASSYYSIVLSWEIGEIVSIGHQANGTLVKRETIIEEELDKEGKSRLFGKMRKVDMLKAYFVADVILSIIGLAMIVLSRLAANLLVQTSMDDCAQIMEQGYLVLRSLFT